MLSAATPRDAAALAALHAASFNRGWSEHEFEQLAHRPQRGRPPRDDAAARLSASSCRAAPPTRRKSSRSRSRRHGAAAGLRGGCSICICAGSPGFGLRAVFLEVDEDNAPARRLYARAGFREVGRRPGYYPSGGSRAALVLRRDLVLTTGRRRHDRRDT